MFASIILVCALSTGQCTVVTNGLYRTEEQCHTASDRTIITNLERAARGEFLPHMAFHMCVDFRQAL